MKSKPLTAIDLKPIEGEPDTYNIMNKKVKIVRGHLYDITTGKEELISNTMNENIRQIFLKHGQTLLSTTKANGPDRGGIIQMLENSISEKKIMDDFGQWVAIMKKLGFDAYH